MCGIVAGIAARNVTQILIEGLKRLEYRGYDSAGLAVLDAGELQIRKTVGKVQALESLVQEAPAEGNLGIAHTRWATHGKPSTINAHPHHSSNRFALVHNGIIENYKLLKEELIDKGYSFQTETDTEVLVHLVHEASKAQSSLFEAVQSIIPRLEGAYGIAIIDKEQPDTLVVARSGSPLLLGLGLGENFAASDFIALRQVTDRFIYLEEGDIAELTTDSVQIVNEGKAVARPIKTVSDQVADYTKGHYKHYMLKEIHEQPAVIKQTLSAYLTDGQLFSNTFSKETIDYFTTLKQVSIVACGTSYHAALVAKYWIEDFVGISCSVEIASEFRYRPIVVPENSLFLTISQSGETADTLAALKYAKQQGYACSLAICNIEQSSLVRESDVYLLTHAGREIGVASTKAFTTQLTLLLMFSGFLAKLKGKQSDQDTWLSHLLSLPVYMDEMLEFEGQIETAFQSLQDKHHSLFLGRGVMYPIAMEGALKLKEISYIHAEAYAAGELKHGPLALVDSDMPVVTIAPSDDLLEKLKSNLEEVQARGGHLYVFSDSDAFENSSHTTFIKLPKVPNLIAPIVYTVPLQLLSYYVAVLKGTDVDQPRNLAKSVTVE